MKKLFLDDVRSAEMVFINTIDPIYENNNEWEIVRSFNEFVSYIEENGLPEFISFDHDLDFEHYKLENQQDIDYEKMEIKTGFHAAQWLINYCAENKLKLPNYKVHSMNLAGKRNIERILEKFKTILK
jgi:hypothetical protein